MQHDVAQRGDMRSFLAGVAILAASACSPLQHHFDAHERFVVYYHQTATPADLAAFETLVLDGDVHPDLAPLKAQGHRLIGYVSVGEIKAGSSTEQLFDDSIKVSTNLFWKSTLVDIRSPQWQSYVLDTEIPALLAKGFDGVMLDTIDSALHLEALEPQRFAGTTQAAAHIVKTIRARHPHITIMMNRGFDLLPLVASDIDILLAESTLSRYDLASRTATFAPDEDYRQYLAKIRAAQQLAPHLAIYTLDYWDMNDPQGVGAIYAFQRKQGFVPYVATPDLQQIHHESNASPSTVSFPKGAGESRNHMKGYTHA